MVYARLDTTAYQTKLKPRDDEIKAVNLTRDSFHGEWNYTNPNPNIPALINE